ncbi:Uncharacterized protein Fot_48801 [Forsythia ovata]|uniref:Uncharacterized protein n=1 Tax=Forsythia ovata TaxID=205694 RepID=A0ABD1QA58_9LAMI
MKTLAWDLQFAKASSNIPTTTRVAWEKCYVEREYHNPKVDKGPGDPTPLVSACLQINWNLLFSVLNPIELCEIFRQIEMKKGIHPQMQWISYVTQSGRVMPVMMTKIHQVGKVYHFRAKRQMAQSIGQIAKFKRRYGQQKEEDTTEK